MVTTFRSRSRALALSGAAALLAATALGAPAFAADRPADADGAKAIADFLSAYAGKAALPSVKVEQQGGSYRVSFDLSAAMAGFRSAGLSYEPAEIAFNVARQDDGRWRLESQPLPPIVGHVAPPDGKGEKVDVRVETTNARQTLWLDPELGWLGSTQGGVDKASVVERGPGIEEFIELADVKIDGKTTRGPNGLTTSVAEPIGSMNFVLDADPKGVDPRTGGPRKPVHVSAQGRKGHVEVALADFQPGPITDAWKFSVAHPEKADMARDFDALKPVLTALAADHMRAHEDLTLDQLDVLTDIGTFSFQTAAVEIGAANMGADTSFSERISAKTLKLPPGAINPPGFAPLAPSSFDFGFKASGFDVEGAVQEWLADAKPGPEGVEISPEDRAKVMNRLGGSRPVAIDILASRFIGESLDLGLEGHIKIENKQATGAVTLTMKDFDKTAEAIERADPKVAQQLTPAIAMAKGLGKPGADGALVWVCTVGADRVIKVNGMPMGKAPF